jgi:hypothetical protein
MPHARAKNVHAKPLKLLKPRAAPINTCVENDDWPRAKPGGRKRYQSADRKELVRSNPVWTPSVQDRYLSRFKSIDILSIVRTVLLVT